MADVFEACLSGSLINKHNFMKMQKTIFPLIFILSLSTLFAQIKAPWIELPQSQWPTITLINKVLYKNGDTYVHPSFSYAGTGFLIDTGKDTLAATVKHALWVAPNKQSNTVEINDALERWVMKPKYSMTDSVIVDRLLNEDSTEVLNGASASILERDWLVFSIKHTSQNIQPLKVRFELPQPGERVFMLSCAYQDSLCTVSEGRISRTLGNDLIIERDMSGNLGGASGSPIIDINGNVVGIFSAAWNDPRLGKNVGIGVSTDYLEDVLSGKKPLNTAKKSYGDLMEKVINEQNVEAAIQTYKTLTSNPENYFIYNLRSSHGNDLLKLGQRLLEKQKIDDAIAILILNTVEHPTFFNNFNVLAKAYLQKGDTSAAIKAYESSLKAMTDPDTNPAAKELEKLRRGNDE